MKKTREEFIKMLPNGFTLLNSNFESGMQTKVKIRNNITGKVHTIKAENYIYLNKNSNRISEKMIIDECKNRNFEFVKRLGKNIIIKREKEYNILLSNFMSGMDPKEIGVQKRNKTKIKNSLLNFKSKSKRDDIEDYDILEFSGMKKPMKVLHIPTSTVIDILNPQIFNNGGYRNFPWYTEKHQAQIQEEFLEKFNSLSDHAEYIIKDIDKPFYKNNKTPIEMTHTLCGNSFACNPGNFLNLNNRCPYCALKGKSGQEIEVLDFIRGIYSGEVVHSFKIDGLEIDIFIPDLKIGIEYNGLYWHSEQNGKDKNYHINKTNKMQEHGYRLIHIFEDEWVNKNEIVKEKLKHILHITNGERIYARKCHVAEITSKEKNEFLENNHIQGSDNSGIRLGLFYNNNLVSVMTFSRPRGGIGKNTGKTNIFELVRFASLKEDIIIGGFGKILDYFRKNYDFERIITYADLRWSVDSNMYEKLNFKRVRKTEPNYWYADRSFRYHRYGFRKQVLKDKFPVLFDSSLTEFEIMNQTNYYRIWDCGNLVYELVKE